jgi:hypothetical protein
LAPLYTRFVDVHVGLYRLRSVMTSGAWRSYPAALSVESFDKSAIPADRVYGDFTRPGLRLITCGGRWVGGATGYAYNVIVFASLVSARNVKT